MAQTDPADGARASDRRRFLTATALLPLGLAACRFPRDPDDTLVTVSGGAMRVGVLESRPWAAWDDDTPEGVEVELARDLAAAHNAEPAWHRRRESDLRRALAEGELDLLIGGLTDDDPWKQHLAFTRPYIEVPVLVFAAGGGKPLPDIDDLPVAVPEASPLAARVAEQGARPVPGGDPTRMASARPAWNRAPGDTGDAIVVATERHVMAVRKGENAWLLALERHLDATGGADLRRRLAEAAA